MTWNNIITTPQRWMAYYLQRRGWVCFYLEACCRTCGGATLDTNCWLRLYQESEAAAHTTKESPDESDGMC